jgi:pyridinium-3,5-bisthiocarboxylic acid mononucleotide nickel chelatase
MKIAYFDCLAGASGDMILAALLDAGLTETSLREGLKALQLDTFDLTIQTVLKNGFRATQLQVKTLQESPPRRLEEIYSILQASRLEAGIREKAGQIFERLASVEAGIHGKSPAEVHLHELSADDTVVDVVGALVGIQELGIERIVCSPLPLGRGFVQSAHGPLPLPAPATLELLQGVPVFGSQAEFELVTPTAAVLLTTLAHEFGVIPSMRLERVGYGAGQRDLPNPNLLRVILGTMPSVDSAAGVETLYLLETNLDDFNPQFYEQIFQHLFEAGAVDVFLTPIQMKKNRPGSLLSLLCSPGNVEALEAILFNETSTLGVRRRMLERRALPRTTREIQTPWGTVRIKIARLGEGILKAAPEYEDCRLLAEQYNLPVREVYLEAQVATQAWLNEAGKDLEFPQNF